MLAAIEKTDRSSLELIPRSMPKAIPGFSI
jgi:hypothetical protein